MKSGSMKYGRLCVGGMQIGTCVYESIRYGSVHQWNCGHGVWSMRLWLLCMYLAVYSTAWESWIPLLLQDIIQRTPESHPDYQNLLTAKAAMVGEQLSPHSSLSFSLSLSLSPSVL